MAVPARPVSGAPTASDWGGIVHDEAVGVLGVEGSGNAITALNGVFTPTVLRGRASMVVGTDVIVPVDGLWEVHCHIAGTTAANGVLRGFLKHNQSGSFADAAYSMWSAPSAGWAGGAVMSTLLFLSAGKAIRFTFDGSASVSVSLARYAVAYRGADWAP